MKYLLFNVAVAAALVFLFTADRGEVQKIAGQVHDAAGDMKAYANKMLNAGQGAVKTGRKVEPAPAAAPSPLQPAVTQPEPAAEPPSQPPSQPPLSRRLAGNLPAMPEIGSEISREIRPETGKAAAVDLNPAVARRRREVLDGIATADAAADAAPALKEGTGLMTPSERRRELLSLAEEMELLYARSISR